MTALTVAMAEVSFPVTSLALPIARPTVSTMANAMGVPGGPPVFAMKGDRVDPQSAAAARAPIESRAQAALQSGDPRAAAMELETAAFASGDPALFLGAAEAYYQTGEKERDVGTARRAIELANVALDILHFLSGPGGTSDWAPVSKADVGSLIARANEILRNSNQLVTEIESEPSEELVTQTEDEPKTKGSGRKLVIGGAVLSTLGVAGVGVGVTGLVLGQMKQNEAAKATVYGDAYDEVDRQGKLANAMAYAGLIGGGLLLAVGITLLVLGKKRQRSHTSASLRVSPTSTGVLLSGEF